MPNCRFGPTCNKKATCKFVHDPCKNPACIAAGKQNTHDDDKCGVLDPSRSPEEQRQAHKDFIAAKREASMAAKAAKKAKAAEAAEAKPPEVAPAASDKPPDGAIKLAAMEKLYAQYVKVFTHEESFNDLMKIYPLKFPPNNLAGRIVGMLGEGLELDELSNLTTDHEERKRLMMEALEALVDYQKISAT